MAKGDQIPKFPRWTNGEWAKVTSGVAIVAALGGCASQEAASNIEFTDTKTVAVDTANINPNETAIAEPEGNPIDPADVEGSIGKLTNREVLDLFTIDPAGLNSANYNWKYEWFEERGSSPNILDGGWFLDAQAEAEAKRDSSLGHELALFFDDPINPGRQIRPLFQLDQNFTVLANTIQANRDFFIESSNGLPTEAEDLLLAGTEHILRHPDLMQRNNCDGKCPDIFNNEAVRNLLDYVLAQPDDTVFEAAYICGVYSSAIPGRGTGTDLCFLTRSSEGEILSDNMFLTSVRPYLFPADSTQMNSFDRYADPKPAVMQFPFNEIEQPR